MSKELFGIVSGLVFAVLTVLIMMPMKWPTRRQKIEAVIAAGFERFLIGFLVCNFTLVTEYTLNAALLGFGLSISSAILSRAYLPVLFMGTAGAVLISLVKSWTIG